ncbi:MAG: GDSL-type esterase/lipase family protein [Sheuella sp.]|nr:GDSL-type esterase/lipase family protein [Sheuella sp.]
MRLFFTLITLMVLNMQSAWAEPQKWVTSWIASVQGPYPTGNPSAQPNMSVVFPSPANGANNQSFRMMVKPDLWSNQTRVRLSNAMGTQAVTFSDVYIGLQLGSAELVPGTNRAATFKGKKSITVPAGESVWSDAVDLPFVTKANQQFLDGKKLAVSFYIPNTSGPMTWHAKALTTSYVTPPEAGMQSNNESESAFSFTTASWFFLDAVDMKAAPDTQVIVAFGDSITDGTASTMNGDDRWPDVLARRLRHQYGHKIVVLNAGIGGNQIAGPAEYSPTKPFAGGPSSSARLERDVLSLSGVNTLIWLEGINDFSKNGMATPEKVITQLTEGVKRLNQAGIRVIGATVGSALGSTSAAHGFPAQDEKRQTLNNFIRNSDMFVGVIDFDAVTLDTTTGQMRPEFVPDSTVGGVGDKLHPNRAGYHAMGHSIDLDLVAGRRQVKP